MLFRFLGCIALALIARYTAQAKNYLPYFIALIFGGLFVAVVMYTYNGWELMGLWKSTFIALVVVCSLAIGTILDLIILDFKDGIVFLVLICLIIGSVIGLMLL